MSDETASEGHDRLDSNATAGPGAKGAPVSGKRTQEPVDCCVPGKGKVVFLILLEDQCRVDILVVLRWPDFSVLFQRVTAQCLGGCAEGQSLGCGAVNGQVSVVSSARARSWSASLGWV